jgi:hypothetical protein
MLSPAQQRARTRAIARSHEQPIHGAGGGSLLTETALLVAMLVIVGLVIGLVVWPHVASVLHTMQATPSVQR